MSKLLKSESRGPKAKWFASRNPSSYLEVEDINMDLLVGFSRTQKQYDSIWVVVQRLTKSSHFIPVKFTYLEEYYARIFIDEIVYRHGILLSIIFDRGDTIHI